MPAKMESIQEYLDAHPIICHEGTVDSLLAFLHEVYSMHCRMDNEEVRGGFQALRETMGEFAPEKADDILSQAANLCFAHEELGFSHGILVGMHLMSELWTMP